MDKVETRHLLAQALFQTKTEVNIILKNSKYPFIAMTISLV